ncbi:MAG: reverse transcriptase domain-containing protein [Pseudomonadota bacterium]
MDSLRKVNPTSSAARSPSVSENELTNLEEKALSAYPDVIRNSIFSFRSGSAGGPDGLLPQHLKDMCGKWLGETADRLLETLAKLATVMLHGKLPKFILPTIYGASLSAFLKPNGGIRPIACGFTLRRVVGKTCCLLLSQRIGNVLRPRQLGCGTPGGSEAAVHAARSFCNYNDKTDKVLLKIDFRNALNTVNRDTVLAVARQHVPEIFPFVNQCYAGKTNLLYKSSTVESAEGVQQGDPLGPMLFCLAIDSMVKACDTEINIWYLDDGTLGGPLDEVIKAFQKLVAHAKQINLEVNCSKCEFLALGTDEEIKRQVKKRFKSAVPGIRELTNSKATLLGAPLFDEGVSSALEEKLADLERFGSRLSILDPHDAFFLLTNCLSIPKLVFLLRSAPCFMDQNTLFKYDRVLRRAVIAILNLKIDEQSWIQACLPVKFGGIGVRYIPKLSYAAYLASTGKSVALCQSLLQRVGSLPIVHIEEALYEWKKISDQPANGTYPCAQRI